MKSFNIKKHARAMSLGLSALLMAPAAFAQTANDAGGVARTLFGQFGDFANLLTGGAFVAGIFFFFLSFWKFKSHNDDPRSTPLKTPVMLLFIGALCIALPWVASTTKNTLGANGTSNSLNQGVYNQIQ